MKRHPLYLFAKAGDITAAQGLVRETVIPETVEKVSVLIGSHRPALVPVHAMETQGVNSIPMALAQRLSLELALRIETKVVQINTAGHTGADGYTRLAFPALFDGDACRGDVLLVDDFVGQGGTLANLKGYLESRGAAMVGATTLTGKAFSAKLNQDTLTALRARHGDALERWWADTFGYGFEGLTESEARYLTRADDADAIAARVVAARRRRDTRLS